MDLKDIKIPENLCVKIPEEMKEKLIARFTPEQGELSIKVDCALCERHRQVIFDADFICVDCPFEKFASPYDYGNRGCAIWLNRIMRILGYEKFYAALFVEQICWDRCFDEEVREQMAELRRLVIDEGKAIEWV